MTMLAVSQSMPTEEVLTSLHIQLYHPDQAMQPIYSLLKLNFSYKIPAEDPVRLGRDGQMCNFLLNDARVSRKQLSIQAFRRAGSHDMRFSVQNMSQRGKVLVSGVELSHLERADLDDKTFLRFGKYEMLIWRDPGEAEDCFEVVFEKLNIPPSREMGIDVPCQLAVMDTSVRNCQNAAPISQEPLESDETVYLS